MQEAELAYPTPSTCHESGLEESFCRGSMINPLPSLVQFRVLAEDLLWKQSSEKQDDGGVDM